MSVDETTLPPRFREGLAALRDLHALEAPVVAVAANFAYIDLGEESLPELYRERVARLFVRIALNFPDQDPYGLVVAPTLHRVDGGAIDRQHPNGDNAKPVGEALGLTDIAFWSWDWTNMPKSRPADMGAAVEWGRKRLRQG